MIQAELQTAILGLNSELSVREASANILTIKVPSEYLLTLMKTLRDDSRFSFDQLQLHTTMDWTNEDPVLATFECLYLLNSTVHHHDVMISVHIPRANPKINSVSALWPIAQWQEREVYDMFGVLYENHPDLRRILLDDDWKGFPLRKDYQDDFMLRRTW